VSRALVIFELVLIAIVLGPLLVKLGLGRLPGDVVIERDSFHLYIPIVTISACERGAPLV